MSDDRRHLASTEAPCGPGICAECLLRWAAERPATPTAYCWRNGVASFPVPDESGDSNLVLLGAEALAELHAKGVL
jgi:hypothetical protein